MKRLAPPYRFDAVVCESGRLLFEENINSLAMVHKAGGASVSASYIFLPHFSRRPVWLG